MQPRPCDCTPMCVLRTENPMNVRPARSDRAAPSVYRPDGAALADRLTSYAVLAHDPAVRTVAADYWLHSEPYYRAVIDALHRLTAGDAPARDAVRELSARPDDIRAELRVHRLLAGLATTRAGRADAERAVREADGNVYIDYLRGAQYLPAPAPATTAALRERAGRLVPRPDAARPDLLVVVPLMDRGDTGRLRNLLACLLALRDQTLPASRYRVTVAEFDTEPRWETVVRPLADHYVHVRADGPFNKSWTLNAGVRHSPGHAPVVCLLDADILADRDFLRRNLERFGDAGHAAHLPHTEMLSLDHAASDAVITQRCLAGRAEAPLGLARGLLLRDVPGACLWLRRTVFDEIGGLDERYLGWGGEDEDMLVRTSRAGATTQFDDVLVHLAHTRPAMRRADGRPFNAHLAVGTWRGTAGYGSLTGPAAGVR
ncbi:glycosyltransferase [Actinoplanes sp. G11-F43]|uniref:glycosyltransferase n=1 Tax=Actinoplanes sp. G11-F43 TaxID=3424130 RepID=UPI003D357A55